jgi:hypothetical protein
MRPGSGIATSSGESETAFPQAQFYGCLSIAASAALGASASSEHRQPLSKALSVLLFLLLSAAKMQQTDPARLVLAPCCSNDTIRLWQF